MALTLTRTRTQTALTKLVTMVANVHGDLAFVEELLLARRYAGPFGKEVLTARHRCLLDQRNALYVTLRQFDATLEPESIGSLDGWIRPYGRKVTKPMLRRYLAERESER